MHHIQLFAHTVCLQLLLILESNQTVQVLVTVVRVGRL